MSLIATDQFKIVIGLGQTGWSCARYLQRKGVRFAVCDTREAPPKLDEFREQFPGVDVRVGEAAMDAAWLSRASDLLLSPGVAKSHEAIQAAVAAGAHLTGDIDFFCREAQAPIVAITGSNAKSTVTTLVAQMGVDAGYKAVAGGNLGTPALDLLADDVELYVLELSSFQLETTHELQAQTATVLNISPDHLDRYESMQEYWQTKHRIYKNCAVAVENRDDALTQALLPASTILISFGLNTPDLRQFGIIKQDGESYLARGLAPMLNVKELKIRGAHNHANALAALALGEAVGLPMPSMLETLKNFAGLKHRCQWVADKYDLHWFNDSKGTNVGSTLAALNGLGATLHEGQRIVLIAGGLGKGQSFTELNEPMAKYGRALILIGRDAQQLAEEIPAVVHAHADSMISAVARAQELAKPGDIVLLSPACASFDMFSGYPERGDKFVAAVEAG